MDIKEDINWIKSELDKLNEVDHLYLIDMFKYMLENRKVGGLQDRDLLIEDERNVEPGRAISKDPFSGGNRGWGG